MAKRLFILGILSLILFGPSFSFADIDPYIIGPPQLTSPQPGETDVFIFPTYKWKGGVGAAGTYWYEIDILKYNPAESKYEVIGQKDFLREVNGPKQELKETVIGLSPDRTYWWWVRVCLENEKYCDNWSEKRQFHTEKVTPPPPPSEEPPGNGFIPGLSNPLGHDTLEGAINALIDFLFVLAMGLAPLMVIFAAFLMITAAGEPEKINKARQILLWTVVGVAVILLAKGLPALIKAALGG